MKIIFLFVFTFIYITFSNEKEEFFKPVIDELLERGVDSAFVFNLINHQSISFDERFVKVNVTGYLNKADYSQNYNEYSIVRSKKFLEKFNNILSKAELEYDVPKEVITSIIWIESKNGSYLGKNHILSVFLSTAMANQEKYIDMNVEVFKEIYENDSKDLEKYINKVLMRANKKSNWAINELVALSKIDKTLPISIFNLKGSWAGAFGLSQFLPSSYLSWAVDGNNDGVIDLFNEEDAIFSVANYLKTNGWGLSNENQRKAVFHYNNSNDYVDAVLLLADKIASN